ncbi:MAG: LLM class F420-dependent oxidoreductase [Candidatus Bathyarchaeota archaeon]|nr:LLM class F420-dependent oxidoreductase [Candidatus Bathyarchaeota archaeon]
MVNRVNFGVFLPFYAFSFKETNPQALFNRVQATVAECESLGYHSVWLDDHLMFGNTPILECWTTITALSQLTTKIRLGTMVLCASFRNPALLAKMAATLDVLSNGRLELGIGAGVQKEEHLAYGFFFPEARTRIERLEETVAIIKQLWTEEKASFKGKHYEIKEAVCEPKPVQKPHPPITIGGSGEKLTLKVTARYADRCDFGYLPTIALYKHKIQVLATHCHAIGRDPNEIGLSCWPGGQVLVANNEEALSQAVLAHKPKNISQKDFENLNLIGTPDVCLKKLQPYLDSGFSHFMLFFGDLPCLDGLRLFAESVMKKLR